MALLDISFGTEMEIVAKPYQKCLEWNEAVQMLSEALSGEFEVANHIRYDKIDKQDVMTALADLIVQTAIARTVEVFGGISHAWGSPGFRSYRV
ncbi:uncharacterized protein Z519_10721 [Cladophialophora bantiana CBS 173.52]|uniref:Uncharacterized protein n=1 Tax=Cladophialophora bantiana (strain ATCC 10958 / CBS 173.52 / CDC B-1940 / NIH 8579) TaxID=1442370 RepID=A0A0D2HCN7_CLAB1|nr:uncharacterized protein Z519_10721 [Cladophialophora bantiana CBS 173.52]KIW88675.1 hypothetical protein Z519_10721 [Cladophialophora bantiana CBS 173.52]